MFAGYMGAGEAGSAGGDVKGDDIAGPVDNIRVDVVTIEDVEFVALLDEDPSLRTCFS